MNPQDLPDMFITEPQNSRSATGISRNVPFQIGNWSLYPQYSQGVPIVIDLKERRVFTRALDPCHYDLTESTWDFLTRLGLPEPYRWLHADRLHRLDYVNPSGQTIIINDIICRDDTVFERRKILEKLNLHQLGIRCKPVNGDVYLVPRFEEDVSRDLWCALHLMNQSWEQDFYSGLLLKEETSLYRHQLNEYRRTTLSWHKHKFDNAY